MSDRPQEKTLVEKAAPSYECRACGYVYVPTKGDNKAQIPLELPLKTSPKIGIVPCVVFHANNFSILVQLMRLRDSRKILTTVSALIA